MQIHKIFLFLPTISYLRPQKYLKCFLPKLYFPANNPSVKYNSAAFIWNTLKRRTYWNTKENLTEKYLLKFCSKMKSRFCPKTHQLLFYESNHILRCLTSTCCWYKALNFELSKSDKYDCETKKDCVVFTPTNGEERKLFRKYTYFNMLYCSDLA